MKFMLAKILCLKESNSEVINEPDSEPPGDGEEPPSSNSCSKKTNNLLRFSVFPICRERIAILQRQSTGARFILCGSGRHSLLG